MFLPSLSRTLWTTLEVITVTDILKTFGPAIIAALNVFGVLFIAAVSCFYIEAVSFDAIGSFIGSMF